jgi:hypothetical protein
MQRRPAHDSRRFSVPTCGVNLLRQLICMFITHLISNRHLWFFSLPFPRIINLAEFLCRRILTQKSIIMPTTFVDAPQAAGSSKLSEESSYDSDIYSGTCIDLTAAGKAGSIIIGLFAIMAFNLLVVFITTIVWLYTKHFARKRNTAVLTILPWYSYGLLLTFYTL